MPFLKPLKRKKAKIYNALGFDIETHTDKNTYNLGIFTNETLEIVCYTPQEVQSFLNSPLARDFLIVTTNLGFDFLGTFKNVKDQQFTISERNGTIYTAKYYQHNNRHRKISFYDTIRYFPRSVKELGVITKTPKVEHPSFFPAKPINASQIKELNAYCQNDALISMLFMQNFVLKFLNENGLSLKLTIASISLHDFMTNYLRETIAVESNEVLDIGFKVFYGGRTETFKRGSCKNVTCVDYNSLYPSCMYFNKFPDPTTSYYAKKCTDYDIEQREGGCYVEGVQDYAYIPLLPVRLGGKLLFPYGLIKGYYTFLELRHALKNGFTINKIGEGVIYTNSKPYFKEFIGDKFAIRKKQKENNDPLEVMTKLSMNANFGKWGYNWREKSEIIQTNDLTDKVINNAINITQLGDDYLSVDSKNDKPPCYSFPIWSAYITAYARIKLYNALCENKEHVAYCDTDSLFLINGKKLPTSKELGDLDEEYAVKSAIFVRPKFYFTKKLTIKGVHMVRDKAGNDLPLNTDTFNKILGGMKIHEQRFIKYRSALRSKPHHLNGKLEVNQIIQTHKTLNIEDSKRVWSKPFNINTLQDSKPIKLSNKDYETQEI